MMNVHERKMTGQEIVQRAYPSMGRRKWDEEDRPHMLVTGGGVTAC
jgi:hypothetical protein